MGSSSDMSVGPGLGGSPMLVDTSGHGLIGSRSRSVTHLTMVEDNLPVIRPATNVGPDMQLVRQPNVLDALMG